MSKAIELLDEDDRKARNEILTAEISAIETRMTQAGVTPPPRPAAPTTEVPKATGTMTCVDIVWHGELLEAHLAKLKVLASSKPQPPAITPTTAPAPKSDDERAILATLHSICADVQAKKLTPALGIEKFNAALLGPRKSATERCEATRAKREEERSAEHAQATAAIAQAQSGGKKLTATEKVKVAKAASKLKSTSMPITQEQADEFDRQDEQFETSLTPIQAQPAAQSAPAPQSPAEVKIEIETFSQDLRVCFPLLTKLGLEDPLPNRQEEYKRIARLNALRKHVHSLQQVPYAPVITADDMARIAAGHDERRKTNAQRIEALKSKLNLQ
jgi:hypothetical protein